MDDTPQPPLDYVPVEPPFRPAHPVRNAAIATAAMLAVCVAGYYSPILLVVAIAGVLTALWRWPMPEDDA